MKNLLLLLLVTSGLFSYGQGGVQSVLLTPSYSGNNIPEIPEPDYQYKSWPTMKIMGNDGTVFSTEEANFYPPTKQIIFKTKKGLKELYADKVSSATIDGDLYKSYFYVNSNRKLVKGFFLTLADGPVSLIKQVELKEKRKLNNLMGDVGQQKPKFNKVNRFYIGIENEEIQKIKPSKKSVSSLFPKHYRAMEKFIKKKKLKMRKEADLIKAIEFGNSLLEK